MTKVAGVFSETSLLNVRGRVEEMAFDDRYKTQFMPKEAIINPFLGLQTARLTPLQDKKKIKTVEIEWLNTCGLSVEDNPRDCTLGCTDTSTNTQTYTLERDRSVCFTIDENDFISNDFNPEDALAKALLRGYVLLAEDFAAYIVNRLFYFRGINELTPAVGGDHPVIGHDTEIATAAWTADLMAYLMKASMYNRFTNPQAFSGNLLYNASMNAGWNAGNLDGKGNMERFRAMNINFDLWNMPLTYFYIVSQGAVASVFRNEYDSMMDFGPEGKRWGSQNPFVPQMGVDIYYNVACSNDRIVHKYKMVSYHDIFNNPEGCTDGNTGVLSFVQNP